MFDIALILIIASAGGVIAITGFLVILGRRILEPKKELQQKIDKLEEEVQIIKKSQIKTSFKAAFSCVTREAV